MVHVIIEYNESWPESGPFDVDVHFTGKVAIPPIMARRRAAGFLATEVGMAARAGTPTLVASQPPVWRIPACLTLPGVEDTNALTATIGSIDVDALTGELIPLSPEQIQTVQRNADAFAASLPLPPTTAG